MVTASGSPSAMLAKVVPMVASRGATPRGTAWSRATVTVRPSAPKSLRRRRFRPRAAVVPVGLMSNAGVKVVVIFRGAPLVWLDDVGDGTVVQAQGLTPTRMS